MKAIKNFNEFIKQGIAKKHTPDRSRADFLIEESERNYTFLTNLIKNMETTNENANSFVKICYDLVMEIVRANMLLEGYHATGQGAHEAEVAYLRILGISENDVQFADQLRFFRNGILYYGTLLDKEYAEKVLEFTRKMYHELRTIINEKRNKN